MSQDSSFAGWNSTDDGAEVPVKIGTEPRKENNVVVPERETPLLARHQNKSAEMPDPKIMRLSAFTGITLVLVGAAFYFGYFSDASLRGDLTGGTTATGTVVTANVKVTITTAGTFDPATVAVKPGETMVIENKNADPQVLKSSNGRELFSVQVIFDTPFTYTVPADANGAYVYMSETLPTSASLTINVTGATSVTSASSTSSVASVSSSAVASDFDIPIPFISGGAVNVPASSVSSSSASVAGTPTTNASTEHLSDSAIISLNGSSSSTSVKPAASGALPTNPYTVTEQERNAKRQELLARQAEQQGGVHSGATYKPVTPATVVPPTAVPPAATLNKPKTTTATGPAGTLLMLLPALALVGLCYKKSFAS